MPEKNELLGSGGQLAIRNMLSQLFSHWKLTDDEIMAIVGLPPNDFALLCQRQNDGQVEMSPELMERAGHLLGIHKSLRQLFPQNRDLAYAWMNTRNRAFEGRTPIAVVKENGKAGLLEVRAYLSGKCD